MYTAETLTTRCMIPNRLVRERTKITDILLHLHCKYCTRQIGGADHIACLNDNKCTKRLIEWRPRKNKRRQGGPPIRWMDILRKTIGHWIQKVQDRDPWNIL